MGYCVDVTTTTHTAFVDRLRKVLDNCATYWCKHRKIDDQKVVVDAKQLETALCQRILGAHLDHFTWKKVGYYTQVA